MSNNLVPHVDITEVASQLSVPQPNPTVIGMIGISELATSGGVTTEANKVYAVKSVSQAVELFGDNESYGRHLVSMIRKAFDEGASEIHAVSVGDADTDGYSLLSAEAAAGVTSITVVSGAQFSNSDVVYIGTGETYRYEEKRTVTNVASNTLTLDAALLFTHYQNERVQVIVAKVAADYTDAIAALLPDEDKVIIVSDLNDDDTHAADMVGLAEDSTEDYDSPCVYIRHLGDSLDESDAETKALAHNNKRAIVCWPALKNFDGKILDGGECAAGVAGAIASNGIPKLNHNFTELTTFGGVTSLISDYDSLIEAGVTPIELKYGTIHLVRFLTTWTTNNGVEDATWQEAAVRLNVDNIQRTMQRRIQSKFMQKGNTPTVREAIKQECLSVLKVFASQEILVADDLTGLPAFKDPVVSVSTSDDTKVNVAIEVSPGKPLNFISLDFNVFV